MKTVNVMTKAGKTRRWIWLLTGMAAGGLLGGLIWLAWQHFGGWDGLFAWVWTTQANLHRQLAAALHAVEPDSPATIWSLLGLSLAYGVLHAAGPGHGKAVIVTYLGTHAVQARRGVLLSLLAALAQGLVAIVLIEAVELAAALFGVSLRRTQALTVQAENLSFALIALLGVALTARSLLALWRSRQQRQPTSMPLFSAGVTTPGAPAMRPYCTQSGWQCSPDCDHGHGPTRAQLNQPLSWRTSSAIVLAMGLRPCTGAVLVLLVAHALGLRWTAIAAVFAMSLGTAATVAALAVMAVTARQGALRLLQRRTRPYRLALIFNLLGAAGGCLISLIGGGLLMQGLRTSVHPLL